MTSKRFENIKPWSGVLMTGLLLAAAFPPLEWREAVWVALVPLLLAVRRAAPFRAWRLGFAAGSVFWLFSIAWLTRVTVPGWIFLSLYCALYTGLFAVVAAWWMNKFGVERGLANVGFMLVAAMGWAGLEYGRSTFLTGFPWNPLGASLHGNLLVIQVARLGGAYLVSALAVLVNVAVALTILRYWERRDFRAARAHPELMTAFAALVLAVVYGARVLGGDAEPANRSLRIALVQPNIPQEDKWSAETVNEIYERLRRLTEAAARTNPDLLIWPETSVPDVIRDSERSYTLVQELAAKGAPILLGSMDIEWRDGASPLFYNTAFLFDTNGVIQGVYDKRHLVLFGEYVPLQPFLPFVKALTPIQESFSAGDTSTVFRLSGKSDTPFSVLICFEDTLAYLARESVLNGARLLVNQTNDGWFDPSWAPRQHMVQCVFRAVENNVPAVRSANTGVSCFIDRSGKVYDVLSDEAGYVTIAGFRTSEVSIPDDNMPLTFYTRHGDLFAVTGMAVVFPMALGILIVERNRARETRRASTLALGSKEQG